MRLQLLVTDAEPARDTRPIALDQRIGAARESHDHVAAGLRLQVDADLLHAPPAAVGVEHRLDRLDARARHRRHLDHAHAIVREDPRRARGRADCGEIESGEAVQQRHGRCQKFFGRSNLRLAMMFFWTSEDPPPIVSITV